MTDNDIVYRKISIRFIGLLSGFRLRNLWAIIYVYSFVDHTLPETTKTRYFKLSLSCLVLAQRNTSSTVTLYKSRDVKLFYFWMLWSGLFGLGRVDRPGILSVGSEPGEAWGVKYNIQTGFRLSIWLLTIVFSFSIIVSAFFFLLIHSQYLFCWKFYRVSLYLSFIGHGVSVYSSISSFFFLFFIRFSLPYFT